MSTKTEMFPNLHSKTAATIGTLVGIMTYLFCESGLFGNA